MKKELEKPTIEILKEFKEVNPWRGTVEERKQKFRRTFRELRDLYGIDGCRLHLNRVPNRISQWRTSGWSSYSWVSSHHAGVITMRGRLSVITFLHEFAHALGKGEKGACKWSLHFFEKVFPKKFAKLRCHRANPERNPFWVSSRKKKPTKKE